MSSEQKSAPNHFHWLIDLLDAECGAEDFSQLAAHNIGNKVFKILNTAIVGIAAAVVVIVVEHYKISRFMANWPHEK